MPFARNVTDESPHREHATSIVVSTFTFISSGSASYLPILTFYVINVNEGAKSLGNMDKNDEIIKDIGAIIGRLQEGRWSEHSEGLLLSAQGKLAVYQSNVAAMVADAGQRFASLEVGSKNKEASIYLAHRDEGRSVDDAKSLARIEAEFNCRETLDAKREYEEIRGLLNSMESVITAVQVQLRATNREAGTAKFQNR